MRTFRVNARTGEILPARATRFVQAPTEVWRHVLSLKVFTAGELLVLQTMSQYLTFWDNAVVDHGRGLGVTDIAARCGLDKATVSRHVRRLERKNALLYKRGSRLDA
jgi:DNA-binding MarR family transcriptional regulator